MDDVQRLALQLRERHGDPADVMSFTHIPLTVSPLDVLTRLRHSTLQALLTADGDLLTHPERPYYDPIAAVRVHDDGLVAAGVTASTWKPPSWPYEAGALTIWLAYSDGSARAQQRLSLDSRASGTTLSKTHYDEQRAETGYEGDDHVASAATEAHVRDFLGVVRAITPE